MEHSVNPRNRSPTHVNVAEVAEDKLGADLLGRVEGGGRDINDANVMPLAN